MPRREHFIDRPCHPDEALMVLGISPSPRASTKAWKEKRRKLKDLGLHPIRNTVVREDRYWLSEVQAKRDEIIVNEPLSKVA